MTLEVAELLVASGGCLAIRDDLQMHTSSCTWPCAPCFICLRDRTAPCKVRCVSWVCRPVAHYQCWQHARCLNRSSHGP